MTVTEFDGSGEVSPVEITANPILTGFGAWLASRADLAERSRETYLERVGHFLEWLAAIGGYDDALHSRAGRDRAVDAYISAAAERGVVARTVNLSLSVPWGRSTPG